MCAQFEDLLRILRARFMRKWDKVRAISKNTALIMRICVQAVKFNETFAGRIFKIIF